MTDATFAHTTDRPGFRPEIHGLRGVSIALVVAYHLWTSGRVSGGVDVFLFVSAFLMTGSFARKGAAFRLVDFLVQRFRRLVPLAAIVIAVTLAVGWAVLPPTRYGALLAHGQSSLIYRENWRLISETVDYMAADPQRLNPFQHFWSLSVQGQIFVLFPLVFLAVVAVHRWFGVPLARTLAVVLGVLTSLSFGYALYLVDAAPASAYFNSWARAWEFTGAGLVALLSAWLPTRVEAGSPRVPERTRVQLSRAMSWSGLGLLLVTGVAWGRGEFPGVAALAPLAAAALVIMAGSRPGDPWHAAWWLTRRPITFVADRAYALYLWHWPVYVYFLVVSSTTNPRAGVVGSVLIIAISLALADVSTRLVERRFHAVVALRRTRYALTTILAFALIALSVVGGVSALVDRQARATASLPPEDRPGARVLTAPAREPGSAPAGPGRGIAPGDTVIPHDWPAAQPFCDDGEGLPPRPELGWCVVIEPVGEQRASVAVVGDSHAHQWVSALIPLAHEEGWRIVAYTRPSCRVGSPSTDADCTDYTGEAVDWLLRTRPDYVVGIGSAARGADIEVEDLGWAQAIAPVAEAGITVVNIRDNPRWQVDMPECVQRYGIDDPRCLARRSDKLAEQWPKGVLADLPHQRFLDFSDWLCPPAKVSICPAVIGNTYVYMDGHHLSRAYLESLEDVFADAWRAEVGSP